MTCKAYTKQFWVKKLVILTLGYLLLSFSVYGAEKRNYSQEAHQRFPSKTAQDIMAESSFLCVAAHVYKTQRIKDSPDPSNLLKEAFSLVKSINTNEYDLEGPTNPNHGNPVSLLRYISEELKKEYKDLLEFGKSAIGLTGDQKMKSNKAADESSFHVFGALATFQCLRILGEFMEKETEFDEFLQTHKDETKKYTDLSLGNFLDSLANEK